MQVAGALLGAAILKAVTPERYEKTLGTTSPGDGITAGQGFGIELMITFVFVFAILSSVDSRRSDIGGSVPLTIGLVIAMCHLWAVSIMSSNSFLFQF